jgi:hypothetical protein
MADASTIDSTPTTTPAPPAVVIVPPVTESSSSTTAAAPTPPPAEAAAPPAAAVAPPVAVEGSTLLTPEAPKAGEPAALSAEEQAAADAHAALFGVPEGDYEPAGLPEGTVIDKAALEAVTPVARELGLSNEGFSKLAGVYAEKVLPQVTEAVTSQILAQSAATTAQWATEATESVRTDPAYAGKPLPEVQAIAAKALDRFGGTEFRQYLADTGLGNHPAMLKAMFLAGSAIAEDTTFERGGTPAVAKTRAEKFYGPQTTT